MAQQALPVGLQCFHVEPFFPPFSPVQNRTDDFGASFTHLRRSALQPLPQCTASALAVHCICPCSALPLFTANVCILSRKRLQPPSQTFATAIVNVCGEKMVKRRLLWNPFPHVFIVSRVSPSHPLPVCGSDGDCHIIGIANGFQMKQESMIPRGENDKETIKTEDRVYPLRYDE